MSSSSSVTSTSSASSAVAQMAPADSSLLVDSQISPRHGTSNAVSTAPFNFSYELTTTEAQAVGAFDRSAPSQEEDTNVVGYDDGNTGLPAIDYESYPTLAQAAQMHKKAKHASPRTRPVSPDRAALVREAMEREEQEGMAKALAAQAKAQPKSKGRRTKPTAATTTGLRQDYSRPTPVVPAVEIREVATSGSKDVPVRRAVLVAPSSQTAAVPKSTGLPTSPAAAVEIPKPEIDEAETAYQSEMAEIQRAVAESKALYDANKEWRALVDAKNAQERRMRKAVLPPLKKTKAAAPTPKLVPDADGWITVSPKQMAKPCPSLPPLDISIDNSQHVFSAARKRRAQVDLLEAASRSCSPSNHSRNSRQDAERALRHTRRQLFREAATQPQAFAKRHLHQRHRHHHGRDDYHRLRHYD